MGINEKLGCFIIMPFSKTSERHTEEYWTNHFEYFLKPHIEEKFKLLVERSEPLRGDVLSQIIMNLVSCPIVIADITDNNPNVIWELGIRQCFKHGTITIAEENSELPFDLKHKGTIFYNSICNPNNPNTKAFLEILDKAIYDCLNNPTRPDSPVLEFISTRGEFYEFVFREESIRKINAIILEIEFNEKNLEIVLTNSKENIAISMTESQISGKNKYPFNYMPSIAGPIYRRTASDIMSFQKIESTVRFRIPAIELLIVTRYLNESDLFYKRCSIYYHSMLSINEQLNNWHTNQNATDEWLRNNIPRIVSLTKDLKKEIVAISESIKTTLKM